MTRLLPMVMTIAVLLANRAAAAEEGPWLRVNQIGYLPDDPKIAVLSSDEPLAGEFHGRRVRRPTSAPTRGRGGRSRTTTGWISRDCEAAGEYRVRFGEVASPKFDHRRRRLRERAGEAAGVHATAAMRREPGHRQEVPSAGCHRHDRRARWSTWSAAGTTRPTGSST